MQEITERLNTLYKDLLRKGVELEQMKAEQQKLTKLAQDKIGQAENKIRDLQAREDKVKYIESVASLEQQNLKTQRDLHKQQTSLGTEKERLQEEWNKLSLKVQEKNASIGDREKNLRIWEDTLKAKEAQLKMKEQDMRREIIAELQGQVIK